MEVILTDAELKDVRVLKNVTLDVDIGDRNDFELVVSRDDVRPDMIPYDSIAGVVYVPGTEYGGVIGAIKTDTSLDTVTLSGMTFRGALDKHIIVPPAGQDYKTVTGDINSAIESIINTEFAISEVYYCPGLPLGITVNYQFDRYTSILQGLTKMCKKYGCRLDLSLIETPGQSSYIQVIAVRVVDHSAEIELSQDSRLDFRYEHKIDGVNHLICLGQGELRDRDRIDLYVGSDGSISYTKTFYDAYEVAEVFDYPNAESIEELEKSGRDHLLKVMSGSKFEMDVAALDLDLPIGDIIGGRDYLTGLYSAAPIESKVWRLEGEKVTIDYTLEG